MSKRTLILGPAAALAAILAPAAGLAHHGWSSYDEKKTVTVTGQLSELEWANPHSQAKIAYQGKTWVVVLAPLSRMETRGLTKDMLAPAKAVTIVGYPRSDGTPEMRIERITVDGKTIELR